MLGLSAAGFWTLQRGNGAGVAPLARERPGPASASLLDFAGVAPETLARWQIPRASLAPLPALFDGTEVDGSLEVGAGGHFRPTVEARRLFDYFFLASDLEPTAVIRGRVVLRILEVLPEPGASEAIEVLDRYVALHERLRAFDARDVPQDPREQLDVLRQLRRSLLGSELARTFYAEDEYVTELELARREVLQDPALSARDRQQRLSDIESRLPEPIFRALRESEAPQRVRAEVDALRARGASDAEVFALREREFGRGAAERLRALDTRRADWKRRSDAYHTQRDALLAASAGAAPAEREARLEALRRTLFSDAEQTRVRAEDEEDLAPAPVLEPPATR